ncbi:MAG: hypothetical protein OXH49_04475 [Gemmatimonadetes bacterium]|nr:hypothetical protein [Gemmatimonadota bacterium]
MRNKTLILLLAAVMLLACNDITPPQHATPPPTSVGSVDAISNVAAAIAHSMAAEDVRSLHPGG